MKEITTKDNTKKGAAIPTEFRALATAITYVLIHKKGGEEEQGGGGVCEPVNNAA